MLESERLVIRRFTAADLPDLIIQRSDPDVNKYLGGNRLQNPEAIERRLNFYIGCYEKFGFGMCAMEWKETGAMIGASGLQPLENTGEIEVGYSLIKNFWGRGLATEAARAWLEFGFGTAGLEKIVAVAQPANKGSLRVMEKLGMRYVKTTVHYELDCVLYEISKQQFIDAHRLIS